MKRLILAAAAAALLAPVAFTTAAFARTAAEEQLLSTIDLRAIQRMFPNADLSNLTRAQMGALSSALHSGDNTYEVDHEVRSILNWSE